MDLSQGAMLRKGEFQRSRFTRHGRRRDDRNRQHRHPRLAPPRFDEGHNLFLPASDVLKRELPADVYRHMAQAFDAAYPPEKRCQKGTPGCWLNYRGPDSLYAFSADGIWHDHSASRAVTGLDFSDPVWLRLGFLNEKDYNWIGDSDVRRDRRDRRFWMGLMRWQIAMPWFEMIRLPEGFPFRGLGERFGER